MRQISMLKSGILNYVYIALAATVFVLPGSAMSAL